MKISQNTFANLELRNSKLLAFLKEDFESIYFVTASGFEPKECAELFGMYLEIEHPSFFKSGKHLEAYGN